MLTFCHVLHHVYEVCDVSIAGRRWLANNEDIHNIIDLLEFLNRHPNRYYQRYSRYIYMARRSRGILDEDDDYYLEGFFWWLADYTKYKTIHPLTILHELNQDGDDAGGLWGFLNKWEEETGRIPPWVIPPAGAKVPCTYPEQRMKFDDISGRFFKTSALLNIFEILRQHLGFQPQRHTVDRQATQANN